MNYCVNPIIPPRMIRVKKLFFIGFSTIVQNLYPGYPERFGCAIFFETYLRHDWSKTVYAPVLG